MEGINFVALDVETANYNKGSICSIGLVKFINGEIVDTYETLINPEEKFARYHTDYVHGIKAETVKNSPTYPEIVPYILRFTDGLPVVMHNASFDSVAIRDCNEKYNINDFYMEFFCSCYLSKSVLTRLSYSLDDLAQEFNISLNHHNALSDAMASGYIIIELIKQKNAQDLADLLGLTNYKKLGVINGYERTSFLKATKYTKKDHVNLVDSLDPSYFNEEHPFYRKHAVITGKLGMGSRDQAFELFQQFGGIREENITKKTNFLIMGMQDPRKKGNRNGSIKISTAQKYLEEGQEIELLSEDDFLRMLQLPATEVVQDNLTTEAEQDNLKKITSINGFTFIIDDTSSDRDKRQNIYRGDHILLTRRKTLDPVTPLFAKDSQTVRYENVAEITAPNDIERNIFQTLKDGQELTEDQKEYMKSNYVR